MHEAAVKLNVVTYTMLLDGLCEEGKIKEAEEVFRVMQKDGVVPNEKSYTALVRGHIGAKRMADAMDVLTQLSENKIKFYLMLYGTIVWGLCKRGKFGVECCNED
ncbi:unnamed protein product [Fraxinus pennsylvanica]|uniref:Pentatricopeptide repeat-containing protein n=1 Tax=Fraxinus pennsylvanica TaxID=56036 RepID=A0AAD1YUJ6_9LAMI|nr:unnamed protein product [Fraxinus pennsylvanica]